MGVQCSAEDHGHTDTTLLTLLKDTWISFQGFALSKIIGSTEGFNTTTKFGIASINVLYKNRVYLIAQGETLVAWGTQALLEHSPASFQFCRSILCMNTKCKLSNDFSTVLN